MLGTLESFGDGLWYLPKVFDHSIDYRSIKRAYRETPTEWQMLTPNRLMAMPNNKDYTDLIALATCLLHQLAKPLALKTSHYQT
jgi:hypothetical protein